MQDNWSSSGLVAQRGPRESKIRGQGARVIPALKLTTDGTGAVSGRTAASKHEGDKAMIRQILGLTVAAFLVLTGCGSGSPSGRVAGDILVDEQGIAIDGYDPVAYFLSDQPAQGMAEHSLEWGGATWWFSTAENRALFVASPESYAPAYGGWCAYGMADGYAAQTDPVNGWTIADGKLYLNWDAEVTAEWRADKAAYLKQSEAKWSTVREELRAGKATVYWHEG